MNLLNKSYRTIRSFGLSLMTLAVGTSLQAQTINESFNDITTLTGAGWSMQNLSTPIGTQATWFQGSDATNNGGPFDSYSGAPEAYIAANYNNVDATGTVISNWLISPTRTYSNGDVVTFYTRTTTPGTTVFPDRLEVRMSTNGTSSNVGTTNTSVGDFTNVLLTVNPSLLTTGVGSYPNTWTFFTATISGLAGPTSGRVAFRYFVTNGGPNGANSDYIGVDDVYIGPSVAGNPEVSVTHVTPRQYTQIPQSQVTSMNVSARVTNSGTAAAASVTVTTKIYLAPNMTTPIQTLTGSTTNLATSANAVVALGSFTPSAIGNYTIQHVITGNVGANMSNDTANFTFAVTNNLYARDNANLTTGANIATAFGIGAGPVGYLGAMFNFPAAANLDSVIIALAKSGTDVVSGDGVGDSTRVVIFNVVAGLPSTIIGESPVYIFTPADTLGVVVNTHKIRNTSGGNLILTPGTYFIAVEENQTNVGLAVSNDLFNNTTFYAAWTGQAFTPVEAFGAGFSRASIIRPKLGCINAAGTDTRTVCGSYTWIDGNTYTANNTTATHTIVGGAANGCDSVVTLNLTVNAPTTGTDTRTACGSFVWIDGNTYTANNNTATHTVTGSNGCDSVVTLNLTISTFNAGTDVQSSCGSFVWIDGNTYTASNNSATHTLVGGSVNGCDSVVTLNLTVTTVDASVTDMGMSLMANATGATYQWVDCNNGNAAISGETSQTFTPGANGNYAVEVTVNGCTETSTCFNVTGVSVQALNANSMISLYPNPTKNKVTVDFGVSVQDATVRLIALDGRLLEQFNNVNGKQFTLSLESYPSAMYFLEVTPKNGEAAMMKISKL